MGWQALYESLHQASEVAVAAARRVREISSEPRCAVSACLLGVACRYDGAHRAGPAPEQQLAGVVPLPLCPEVLAGLGVPRTPMAFEGGDGAAALAGDARLLDADGRDCTDALARGVSMAMQLVQAAGCSRAVLKARSPSCGVHRVHTHEGLIDGCGMFTAACRAAGLQVRSDED